MQHEFIHPEESAGQFRFTLEEVFAILLRRQCFAIAGIHAVLAGSSSASSRILDYIEKTAICYPEDLDFSSAVADAIRTRRHRKTDVEWQREVQPLAQLDFFLSRVRERVIRERKEKEEREAARRLEVQNLKPQQNKPTPKTNQNPRNDGQEMA